MPFFTLCTSWIWDLHICRHGKACKHSIFYNMELRPSNSSNNAHIPKCIITIFVMVLITLPPTLILSLLRLPSSASLPIDHFIVVHHSSPTNFDLQVVAMTLKFLVKVFTAIRYSYSLLCSAP